MARGYVTGLLCGSLVSVLGLGTISLASRQPAGSAPPLSPEITTPDIADATADGSPDEVVPDVAADPGGAPAPSDTPEVGTPGRIIPQVQTDTTPLAQPDAGEVTSGLALPTQSEGPVVGAALEEPVLPNPQGVAPVVPDQERDVVLDTTTPEPARVEEDAPEDEELAATDETDAPLIDLQGGESDLPGAQPEGLIAPLEAPQTEPAPSVVAPAVADPGVPALEQFAADFDAAKTGPIMSVILIDDGVLAEAQDVLASIPFPVTIALDPTTDGAADLMRSYRDAGFEVIALAEVPDGALPSDAEVALEAGFAVLPDAIGILDIGQAGLQSDLALAEQAMARLAADGRGFVTQSRGLNTGLRAADGADVPAAVVYRDIDGDAQEARVIRRFLDQAAFRARQQSGVVLVGRVRPDTISALALWGAANAEGQISLAPVSTILNGR